MHSEKIKGVNLGTSKKNVIWGINHLKGAKKLKKTMNILIFFKFLISKAFLIGQYLSKIDF